MHDAEAPPMIHARDVVKRHGALEVLRGVSLDVAQGEVAVVVGPSGGGKSTFLRCLNGLEPRHLTVRLDCSRSAQPSSSSTKVTFMVTS